MSVAPKQIPVPTRGQPIDSSFLNEMVNVINNNATAMGGRKGLALVKPTPTTPGTKTSTSNMSIFASAFQFSITSSSVNETTSIPTLDINFGDIKFEIPPVVTATLVTSDPGGQNAAVTISEVNTSGCKATVKFFAQGEVKSLYVHVIAIGVPV